MRLSRALDLYIGELAREKRTKATRTKYREVLDPFVGMFDSEALVTEPTKADCRMYLDRWIDAAPATIALYVSILTRFFAFLVDEDLIETSPMAKIRRPPLHRPEDLDVVTVSSEDVLRMFAACTADDELICLALLAYLGPRRTAAANLRWRDIDFIEGVIKFREKGAKVITKPMPQELSDALYEIALSGRTPNAPADFVIPNRTTGRNHNGIRYVSKASGERHPRIVYVIVKRVAERAGIEAHPHALRAAFACWFLDARPGDLDALQKLMGHSRVETTQTYLRRQDNFRTMERIRPLSWGASVLRDKAHLPPAGFEPALRENAPVDPLQSKLAELIGDLEKSRSGAGDRSR